MGKKGIRCYRPDPGNGQQAFYAVIGFRFSLYKQRRAESKKKTVVAVARKLAELMYSVLKNKTEFEVRKWDGPKNKINLKAVLENCA